MNKIINSTIAAEIIKDGDTIAVGGFAGLSNPEEILSMIEKKFILTKNPKNLTVVWSAGQGNGKDKGINHFAHKGLVKRTIGGHYGLCPKLGDLVINNEVEAYNLPQGVISNLYREIAAKRLGLITHVGLNTYVDPRIDGGKINEAAVENLVDIIEIDNKKRLFYKSFPIDIAIIRGTSADKEGNISMEKEAASLEMLALAQAAHNSGGKTIVQVERIVESGTLNPWMVKVPSIFIDAIVVSEPKNHMQTFDEIYNPAFSGEIKIPSNHIPSIELNERKVICKRAIQEIKKDSVINLGIGIPESISIVANEEKKSNQMKITIEAGIIGGIPAGGYSFGAAYNPESIIDQNYQFDFYDGGGIDMAFLGMAQVDSCGNVNVSKFSGRVVGCGGFINISQNAKKVIFCGTFTSGGLKTEIKNQTLNIVNEGKYPKFLNKVEHLTFSGEHASELHKEVLYITERAVFMLKNGKLVLKEIAPGMNMEEHVLSQMDFRPSISNKIKNMDNRLFS